MRGIIRIPVQNVHRSDTIQFLLDSLELHLHSIKANKQIPTAFHTLTLRHLCYRCHITEKSVTFITPRL